MDTLPTHPTPADVEMGEKQPEKNWFGSWGKKKHAANGTPATGAQGYGYGGSAYTGNI